MMETQNELKKICLYSTTQLKISQKKKAAKVKTLATYFIQQSLVINQTLYEGQVLINMNNNII